MSLSERLSRVLRAQMTDLVARAEDPRKIVEQAILDLRAEHARARTETARAMAEGTRLKREWRAQEIRVETLHARAEDALRKGQETVARTLLKAKREAGAVAEPLGAQAERHDEAVTELQAKLHALEGKLLELQGRQRLLAARESTVRTADRLDGVGHGRQEGALDAIERMERKITAREDEAQARTALGTLGGTATAFEAMEHDAHVDAELEAMRRDLAPNDVGGGS